MLPYLAIAATPSAGLEVGLKEIVGKFSGYVWWCDYGKKEEVVRKRVVDGKEKRGFDVPGSDWFGEKGQIRVQMAEGPILAVQE